MGCLDCCLKTFYTIIQILKVLISLTFINVGVAFLYYSQTVFDQVDKQLHDARNTAVDNIPADFKKFAPDNLIPEVNTANNEGQFKEIVESLATAILVTGILMFASTFFGCGACCGGGCGCSPLICYLVQIIISAGFIVAIGVQYDKGRDFFREPMENTLAKYKGLTDFSIYSILWSGTMVSFGCCGIDGADDFKSFETWRPESLRNYRIDIMKLTTPPPNNVPQTPNLDINTLDIPQEMKDNCQLVEQNRKLFCKTFDSTQWKTPMACCKDIKNIMKGCMVEPTEENNNMKSGCLHALDLSEISPDTDFASIVAAIFGICIAVLLLDVILGTLLMLFYRDD